MTTSSSGHGVNEHVRKLWAATVVAVGELQHVGSGFAKLQPKPVVNPTFSQATCKEYYAMFTLVLHQVR